jgi:hypothetical protein
VSTSSVSCTDIVLGARRPLLAQILQHGLDAIKGIRGQAGYEQIDVADVVAEADLDGVQFLDRKSDPVPVSGTLVFTP